MFERPAPTDHEIHDLLTRRWSTRAYAAQSIDSETLRRLFEAARWAPSSGNGQPWNFLVARKEDAAEFEKIANCLNPGNAGRNPPQCSRSQLPRSTVRPENPTSQPITTSAWRVKTWRCRRRPSGCRYT